MGIKTFTLSPSDFGFMYNQCKRCYYNKYVNKINRPKYHMPGIFTTIDNLMTKFFDNKPTSLVSPDLPSGIVTLGGLKVQSKPIPCKEFNCEIILAGKIDSMLYFDDQTHGVMDFKTTKLIKQNEDFYFNQLMSYSVALEHNDPEVTKPCKVRVLGLCCYKPEMFTDCNDLFGLLGQLEWIEIKKDKDKFKAMLRDVAELLTGPIPDPNPDCQFCSYRLG